VRLNVRVMFNSDEEDGWSQEIVIDVPDFTRRSVVITGSASHWRDALCPLSEYDNIFNNIYTVGLQFHHTMHFIQLVQKFEIPFTLTFYPGFTFHVRIGPIVLLACL